MRWNMTQVAREQARKWGCNDVTRRAAVAGRSVRTNADPGAVVATSPGSKALKGHTMTDKVSLTRHQQRAIPALLSSRRIEDAAKAVGVSDRQVYRWLKDDDFRQALTTAEGDLIDGAVRSMLADLGKDLDVIGKIRDDETLSPMIRLRAAVAHVDRLLAWRELRNVELRLDRLERLAAEHGR